MTIQRALTDAEQSTIAKGEVLANDLFQLSFQQRSLVGTGENTPHDRTEVSKAGPDPKAGGFKHQPNPVGNYGSDWRKGPPNPPIGKSTDEPDDPAAMPGHAQPKRVGTANFPTDPVHDRRVPAATRGLLAPRPWDKGSKSDSEEPDFSGAGGPNSDAPRGIPGTDRTTVQPQPGASFGHRDRKPPSVQRVGPFDRALRKAIRDAITEELSTAEEPYRVPPIRPAKPGFSLRPRPTDTEGPAGERAQQDRYAREADARDSGAAARARQAGD